MTVVKIPSKKITQFETKQIPTIEQENKIFKKDNIGTVVPGDALRNINLSTVPSVVQDAINAMGLSVETNILANALDELFVKGKSFVWFTQYYNQQRIIN